MQGLGLGFAFRVECESNKEVGVAKSSHEGEGLVELLLQVPGERVWLLGRRTIGMEEEEEEVRATPFANSSLRWNRSRPMGLL
jgi:hypothetical protein